MCIVAYVIVIAYQVGPPSLGAEYQTVIIDLTPAQRAAYDAAANFWAGMQFAFSHAKQVLDILSVTSSEA